MNSKTNFVYSHRINLQSYASSPGFKGFICKKGNHSLALVDDAIQYFHKYCEATSFNILQLATTLRIESKPETQISNFGYSLVDINKYIDPLIDYGIIQVDQPNSSQEKEFVIKEISEDNIIYLDKVLYVIMGLGGVYGHLFLFFEKLGLIIYPHDDIGYGLISSSIENEWVEEFFKSVDRSLYDVKQVE